MASLPVGEPTVLVPIANGTEEMEAVIVIDVLRRAGAQVTVASVMADLLVVASRGVRIVADKLIGEVEGEFDMIVLPGGMPGAQRLHDCAPLQALIRKQASARKWLGAICAAPAVVLHKMGLLDGVRATCHPNFFSQLDATTRSEERVVVHNNIVTSRGPGTAMEFALTLVEMLYGAEKRASVAAPMVTPRGGPSNAVGH